MALALVLPPIAAYFLAKHALLRHDMTEAAYGDYYCPRRFQMWWPGTESIIDTRIPGSSEHPARREQVDDPEGVSR